MFRNVPGIQSSLSSDYGEENLNLLSEYPSSTHSYIFFFHHLFAGNSLCARCLARHEITNLARVWRINWVDRQVPRARV